LAKPTDTGTKVTGTARSRLGLAVSKIGEEAKTVSRIGSARKSIVPGGGLGTTRIRSSLGGAAGEPDGAQSARAGASRLRSGSKEGNEELKFNRTRNTSASRDKDI